MAQLHLAMTSGCPKSVGEARDRPAFSARSPRHTAASPRQQPPGATRPRSSGEPRTTPQPRPAACGPSPRPPACGWGCARGGGRRVQERRRAATSPGWRRAACAPVARVRRRSLPAGRRRRARVAITRFTPAARSPSPRPPACGWGCSPRGGALHPWCARCWPMNRAPSRRDPGTSASGHFAGMPTRSLHARGAVESGDTFRLPVR